MSRVAEKLRKLEAVAPWIAGALALAVYFTGLPYTVQTGDTGELVANAYRLQISHPSGYPLYTWVYYFFVNLVPLGTVFQRAAALTAILSAAALTLLGFSGRSRWLSSAIALGLAFSRIYWKYSVLPDVYALNALFIAAICFAYLRPELAGRRREETMTVLLLVGLANHLSLVFLAPLVGHAWWQRRRDATRAPKWKRKLAASSAAGLALLTLAYLSMITMHPRDFFSWGTIESPGAVLKHFLREDYGREPVESRDLLRALTELGLKEAAASELPPDNEEAGNQFFRELSRGARFLLNEGGSREARYYFQQFGREAGTDFLLPILLFAALALRALRRRQGTPATAWLLGSAAVYGYFLFALNKIPPTPQGLAITERFFLLAEMLFCFALVAEGDRAGLRGKLAAIAPLALLVGASVSGGRYRHESDFSRNTIVEDYAINFLHMVPPGSPGIILSDSDTRYFALRYAQQVLGLRPEAAVLSVPLLVHSWYAGKLKRLYPDFVFDSARVRSAGVLRLEEDLINPNLLHHSFFFQNGYNDSVRYRLTFLGLGRRLEAGRGLYFDAESRKALAFRSTPMELRLDPVKYSEFHELYAEYAQTHLAEGRWNWETRNSVAAADQFKRAVQRVPYSIPALANLCEILAARKAETTECLSSLKELKAGTYDYFPGN